MKKITLIAIIALTSLIAKSQQAPQQPKYPVSLTIQEWQIVIESIDSKKVSQIIVEPLQKLLQAYQAKEQAKQDSVTKIAPKQPEPKKDKKP